MGFLVRLFGAIKGLFTGEKARHVFDVIADMVPKVLPIVKTIAALTPTRADDEIIAAFERLGVPLVQNLASVPADERGYVLLKLATDAAARKYPGTATNILQSAIQIAVSGVKAGT